MHAVEMFHHTLYQISPFEHLRNDARAQAVTVTRSQRIIMKARSQSLGASLLRGALDLVQNTFSRDH